MLTTGRTFQKKPHVLRFCLLGAVAKVPVLKFLGSLLANIKPENYISATKEIPILNFIVRSILALTLMSYLEFLILEYRNNSNWMMSSYRRQ